MLTSQRLLIIESEFIIALDIQRIIEDSNALQTVFARSFSEAATLSGRFDMFDLAIVNAPEPEDLPVAAELAAAGPAIIVCTADATDLGATPPRGRDSADEAVFGRTVAGRLHASAGEDAPLDRRIVYG